MNIHEWLGEDVPAAVVEKAIDWIAVLDDLENKPEEQAKRIAFYQWLGEDAAHQQAFAELSEMWAKTACLESLKSKIDASQVIPFPLKSQQNKPASKWGNQPLLADSMMCSNTFAPSWLYGVTLVTMCLGLILPAIF
ncbi:DUF4880 domain-containing protein [Alteromonas sediminis]|uniref:DUF4880 domain-containing protein n=1 Tax=Alteromonas sediminis TaxID=2259342 RepID=A0A3N5YF04_9ALTE|nr:DUF4880 domain-containing protein [Alteromonas sediminis]RPJ68485.1 DUF4880 domain-containing protein [Alteromonas sediminis]